MTLKYRAILQQVYQPLLKSYGVNMVDEPAYGADSSPVRERFCAPAWGSQSPIHSTSSNTATGDAIIWLPKDPLGICDLLLDTVRRRYFGLQRGSRECCTNSGAEMKLSGQVLLQVDTASSTESFENRLS